MAKSPAGIKIAAQNRKARHDHFIEDKLEAGIALLGTEVKSLRSGGCQLTDAYADVAKGELWLMNAHIPEYAGGNRFNHAPKRPRKLLVHIDHCHPILDEDSAERRALRRHGVEVAHDGMEIEL